MANRSFNRKQALEKEVKDLYALISIGATGAPTLTTGYGFASVSRSTNGTYTLTLEDKYLSLKFVDAILLESDAEDIRFQVKSETVSSDGTISFYTLTGATPTDPSSGSKIMIKVEVKNTSAI